MSDKFHINLSPSELPENWYNIQPDLPEPLAPPRNPKTGEEIPISARRVVTFRPGQKLKARVEAYAGGE